MSHAKSSPPPHHCMSPGLWTWRLCGLFSCHFSRILFPLPTWWFLPFPMSVSLDLQAFMIFFSITDIKLVFGFTNGLGKQNSTAKTDRWVRPRKQDWIFLGEGKSQEETKTPQALEVVTPATDTAPIQQQVSQRFVALEMWQGFGFFGPLDPFW